MFQRGLVRGFQLRICDGNSDRIRIFRSVERAWTHVFYISMVGRAVAELRLIRLNQANCCYVYSRAQLRGRQEVDWIKNRNRWNVVLRAEVEGQYAIGNLLLEHCGIHIRGLHLAERHTAIRLDR